MFKRIKFILAMVLTIGLCGCSKPQNNGKSLYDHGMDVIALMDEMVNNSSYGSLMSNSGEFEQIRLDLAATDHSTPMAVYEIEVPTIRDVLVLGESEVTDEAFSDSLKKLLDNKSATFLVSMVNSHSGAAALASSSMYTASKTFVSSEAEKNTLYLYIFRNGNPIAVVFTTGDDGTVTATGTFLMAEGFDAESTEQLQNLLREAGFPGTIRLLTDVP